ncbi:MAG: hypothetical protein R6W99_03060 [Clostridia bacterium]
MTKIRISLLPAELKKQSSIIKRWTLMALILTIIALILLVGNILLSFYIRVPVYLLESLKTENKSLTENIGRIAYVQEMFDTIEVNTKTIESLMGIEADWAYSINEALADITIYGISVDRLEIRKSGDAPGCKISAWTSMVSNINNWINQARERENIAYVNLSNIRTVSGSGNQFTVFFDAAIGIENWTEEEEE